MGWESAGSSGRMTIYERIQKDKVYCASILSILHHSGEYEPDDYDPAIMRMLDKDAPKIEEGAPDGNDK
jgi:hypothetical protein